MFDVLETVLVVGVAFADQLAGVVVTHEKHRRESGGFHVRLKFGPSGHVSVSEGVSGWVDAFDVVIHFSHHFFRLEPVGFPLVKRPDVFSVRVATKEVLVVVVVFSATFAD